MNKAALVAIKLLKSRQARHLIMTLLKREKVRRVLVKQAAKRLFK